ncbi:EamA family transporter RarD [Hoeflea prorocentri]|uniref:EamA family transporter RarD n=1 Tax=Hoeflea prorocentri TaxID=1922333 RepID=A0A9X3ZI74_9HYPH|nr:EamA family transporter RarD [Hoeflea prorocentri]MCY6381435.1 EamA family transporter RarD [Hoeflea prorocentri]MDA5399235.1 EamA family transporter RarD [Hoeflea prorocentri]
MNGSESGSATRGFAFGISAYLMWGLLPFYMKAVDHVPAIEVVAYRILCSIPVAGIIILFLGRTADLKQALRTPRTLALAFLTATMIAVNWGIYTWAVAHERTVETALGYYINPLVSIMLGALFLGERFNRAQLIAIALAVVAVMVLTYDAGGLPWVSLSLAFSFGFYGFFRKTMPIGPSQGFFLEVVLLSVPALFILLVLDVEGMGHFFAGDANDTLLLLFAGPATAIPLICYALGAKLLRLSTIGLMQYVAPTLIFLIAVFVFREPFSGWQLLAFCLIWLALGLYSWSAISDLRAAARRAQLDEARENTHG